MGVSYHEYWRGLVTGGRSGPFDRCVLLLLAPLAWLYSAVMAVRSHLYGGGIFTINRLPRPVISIGNVTVGGTGKTPVTAFIARYLLEKSYRVAVLSRGYGGSLEGQTCIVSDGITIMMSARECGDEPYLLASTVPGLMVVIGTDRYAAGNLALRELSPDLFLLDDAFQHLGLHRDLNILLLDYVQPDGNGRTIPAGMLREPWSAVKRADLIIHTRCPAGVARPSESFGKPGCAAHHTLTDLIALSDNTSVSFNELQGSKVLAFAGIADTGAFFAGLRERGVHLVDIVSFPDHVVYDAARIRQLIDIMRSSGADFFITTEKDGVKLNGLSQELKVRTFCAKLILTIDDAAPLQSMLCDLLPDDTFN